MEKGPEQNFINKGEHKELSPMIEELRIPLQNLLKEMKNSIEQGEYKTIIGDDRSGRIPTLVLNKVIKNIYKDKKYEIPQILFLAGSKDVGLIYDEKNKPVYDKNKNEAKKEQIKKHLLKYLKNKNEKILISTEYFQTGSSVSELIKALKELEQPFEICTISSPRQNATHSDSPTFADWHAKNKDCKIFYGIDTINVDSPPLAFGEKNKIDSAGVYKKPENILSISTRKYNPYNLSESELQKNVSDARQEVKILSDQLTEWYKNNLENK